jgi:membrane fusion protein
MKQSAQSIDSLDRTISFADRTPLRQQALAEAFSINDTISAGRGSLATWIIVLFLVCLCAATVAFLTTATYTKKETVTGQLVPKAGAFTLSARMAGSLTLVTVREGDSIKRGQPIAVISADPILLNGTDLTSVLRLKHEREGRATAASMAARSAELKRQKEEQYARQSSLRADIERLKETRAILLKRASLQADGVRAHRNLAAQGMISLAGLRQHEDNALAISQQLSQLDREIALQWAQIHQSKMQIARLAEEERYNVAQAQVSDAQLAERQLNDEARYQNTLVAPIDGIVAALPLRQGSQVTSGQPIAVIVPSSSIRSNSFLEVELWAPSRAVGFVRPGMHVRLMYDSFPYQSFGAGRAVVKHVTLSPVVINETIAPGSPPDKQYRITADLESIGVRVNGAEPRLIPGMRVTADLIMEEQTIADLVLKPIRSGTQRNVRWP